MLSLSSLPEITSKINAESSILLVIIPCRNFFASDPETFTNFLDLSKNCPLSTKNAPVIDYKNISLLKKYVSENRKLISSKITSVSQNKQRKLSREIKKAKILGLL